jgi:tyrosine-protein kinase
MTDQSSDFTLRAYLDVIRRRRWLILIVAAICAVAALGFSVVQKKTYSATSSLTANDPNQYLAELGGNFVSTKTPLQEASIAAQQVTRPEVVTAVAHKLGRSVTRAEVRNVSVSVDPNSYVINITASSRSPSQAAAIANAYASVDASRTTAEVRQQYAAQAASVGQQLRKLPRLSPLELTTADSYNRLKSLSQVATPLTTAATATVPTSPSSPKTARNTLAALLFGLLLGLALATGRDAFDRRLRRSRDVVKILDHPVIGHIRTEALGHAGAPAEASNGIGPLDDPDQESFRILRQNIWYLEAAADSRTLLVTSPMAQEGKSTVAACLAVATAEAGKRTLLVECDLRKPVLAKRFRIKQGPGLADYLTGNAQPQEILQPIPGLIERLNGSGPALSSGRGGASNLVCITAGKSVLRPAELLASERFRTFLGEVSEIYDSVILDTAPLLPVADTLAIVPGVSTLIVCIRLEHTTRDQARAAQTALERLPERAVGLVLTDVSQPDDGYYYGYYGAAAPTSA